MCFIYEIVGKDITEKTVSNLAHIEDLVNFALEDAAAVEMKYVIERLVALVTILWKTYFTLIKIYLRTLNQCLTFSNFGEKTHIPMLNDKLILKCL